MKPSQTLMVKSVREKCEVCQHESKWFFICLSRRPSQRLMPPIKRVLRISKYNSHHFAHSPAETWNKVMAVFTWLVLFNGQWANTTTLVMKDLSSDHWSYIMASPSKQSYWIIHLGGTFFKYEWTQNRTHGFHYHFTDCLDHRKWRCSTEIK